MMRVAVIGAGHWGPNLVRAFHGGPRSTVTHVVDVREERLASLAPRYPGVACSTDAEAVLALPEVDAVAIATPAESHFALARRALEAGKHVLVEKPITRSSAEAAALGALAQRRRRVLLVGHVFLFNPAVQRARELVAQGALGPVRYLSMVRANLGPVRRDVDAAWDLAAHDVSMAEHWLGAPALSVSAVGGVYLHAGVADVVFATLRFPGGVLVHLHASWLCPRKTRDITIVGEQKMLRFDDTDPAAPLRLYDSALPGEVELPPVAKQEPLQAECEHFLDCILDGAAPRADATHAASVVRTLEALTRSLAAGGAEVRVW